jgi:excisionase family DNA binding protein
LVGIFALGIDAGNILLHTQHVADVALNGSEWMTSKEVAALVGVTAPTVRSWKHRGSGPPCYVVVGAVRYRRSEVEAWLEAQRLEPSTKAS